MASQFLSRWMASRSAQTAALIVAGILALTAGMGIRYVYSNYFIPKQVSYRLCVGSDAKSCPPQTVFVQNSNPLAVTDWINKECAKYKRRETIEPEGPDKDCNCLLIQVTCVSAL